MPPKIAATRILIVLHGSIGDVTRALPLAALLRRGFPKAFIAWSVEPACYPLLLGNPAIDEIILFQRNRWWKTFIPFLRRIRAQGFDLVLDLQRILKSGLIGWLSGAPQRLGFHPADAKEGNGWFNNHHIERCGDNLAKLDHYLKFADYLAIPKAPIEWDFALSADERAKVDGYLSQVAAPFAALFVGTRWASKQWFPQQMADCAAMLRNRFALSIVLLGGPEDRALADQAQSLSQLALCNLTGATTLREAAGIIQRASLAVGPDTGLMHIAAALGTPVIGLFGATDPRRTGPHGFADLVLQGRAPCVPCNRKRCSIGRVCMSSIAVGEIGDKAASIAQLAPHHRSSHVNAG